MNEQTDIELIEHIKNVLQSHEEPYKEGSWEKFVAHSLPAAPVAPRKPARIYWLAAASLLLLLGAGTFFLLNNSSEQPLQAVAVKQQPPKIVSPANRNITDNNNTDNSNTYAPPANNKLAAHIPVEGKNIPEKKSFIDKITEKVFPSEANSTAASSIIPDRLSGTKSLTTVATHKPIQNTATQPTDNTAAPQQDANNRTQKAQHVYPQKNVYVYGNPILENEDKIFKKWNIAAEIASSMGNTQKLNMSYGLNIGYSFNDKLSVHSGASYAQLSSAIGKSATPASKANTYALAPPIEGDMIIRSKAAAEPSVRSSEIRLAGIEIPLEMRYHFNKKLYTNVGISTMALVENKQINTYVRESERPVGFARSDNAALTSTNDIEEKRIESISGTGVVKDNFIEFFNMSLGYKQPITNKRNIRIEPFVKIPLTNSGVKVPLSNAGVKIGFEL